MNAERALVSKVAQTRRGLDEVEHLIRPEHFAGKDCLEVWEFMRRYRAKYGRMPLVATVHEERIHRVIGHLPDAVMYRIDECLKAALGLR